MGQFWTRRNDQEDKDTKTFSPWSELVMKEDRDNIKKITKILFICHGNICRSPMAEFIMKDLVNKAGRDSEFEIASAATSTEEIGNPVYPPAKRKLAELEDNLRAAKAILKCFPDTYIEINAHRIILNEKNPEYTIDHLIADRKGIMSERGVRSSFEKGKKQCCKAIVLDMDKHLSAYHLHTIKLAKELYFRQKDFREGLIERCYVVYRDNATCITSQMFTSTEKEIVKQLIAFELQKIAE